MNMGQRVPILCCLVAAAVSVAPPAVFLPPAQPQPAVSAAQAVVARVPGTNAGSVSAPTANIASIPLLGLRLRGQPPMMLTHVANAEGGLIESLKSDPLVGFAIPEAQHARKRIQQSLHAPRASVPEWARLLSVITFSAMVVAAVGSYWSRWRAQAVSKQESGTEMTTSRSILWAEAARPQVAVATFTSKAYFGPTGLRNGCGRPMSLTRSAMNSIGVDDSANLLPHHLSSWNSKDAVGLVDEANANSYSNPLQTVYPDLHFYENDTLVTGDITVNDEKESWDFPELESGSVRAGPCRKIWWEPSKVRAGLVTCGGLCPGLNSIIREVTSTLENDYGVTNILGIPSGYNGLSDPENFPPVKLTSESVEEIHMKGGSILKAARGGLDLPKICKELETSGINVLFVIGGDGTQMAGHLLFEAVRERNLPVSIIGIPKSIDNDVLIFDKTFGFDTAVASASDVVRNAWVEATSCEKGVGIVKLMGRDAGFVAMKASLASTIVDLVLIPEVDFKLDDVYDHIDKTLEKKKYMVIVVAEGAGQEYVSTGAKDSTGHTVYGDIGTFIRDSVNDYLKSKGGRSFYIDPSYIIRSVPIRPLDHTYCIQLSRSAVHTAMRGYSGVCVGALHNIEVIIPSRLIARGKRKIDTRSAEWQSCVLSCNMPSSLAGFHAKPQPVAV